MKQKKLLVWGIVLACVMFAMELVPALFLGYSLTLFSLLMTCLLPAAACGILAASAYEKRGLGISSAAVALLCRTISLINFCSVIVGYGFNASFLFSLVMQQMYMVVAVLWFLRFILNRPMRTPLIVVAIVGAALSGMSFSADLVLETVSALKGHAYMEVLIASMCYGISGLSLWAVYLLASFAQPRHTAKSVPETVEAFDETLVEPAAETVAAAEEETVPMPVQEDPAPASNALDALERLAKLHERGILTDAEFESKKAELLSKI